MAQFLRRLRPELMMSPSPIKQEEARAQAIAEAPRYPICGLRRSANSRPGSNQIALTSSPRCRRCRVTASRVAPTTTWAGFAAHALRPGGVLLASAHRAEILPQLAVEGLGYCWIVVCCEPDGRTQVMRGR